MYSQIVKQVLDRYFIIKQYEEEKDIPQIALKRRRCVFQSIVNRKAEQLKNVLAEY